jgi:hypothetical protein
VAELAGLGPELVHWNAERLVVETLDQGSQTPTLPGVLPDDEAVVSHAESVGSLLLVGLRALLLLFLALRAGTLVAHDASPPIG